MQPASRTQPSAVIGYDTIRYDRRV